MHHTPEKRAAVSEYSRRCRVLAADRVTSERRAMSEDERYDRGLFGGEAGRGHRNWAESGYSE